MKTQPIFPTSIRILFIIIGLLILYVAIIPLILTCRTYGTILKNNSDESITTITGVQPWFNHHLYVYRVHVKQKPSTVQLHDNSTFTFTGVEFDGYIYLDEAEF